jgi:hypothetical protein
MKWLVDQIYGAGSSDPYYQFFVDADALIPWWYPTMICTITAVILLYRFHNRLPAGAPSGIDGTWTSKPEPR